jgi:hypothetical protein
MQFRRWNLTAERAIQADRSNIKNDEPRGGASTLSSEQDNTVNKRTILIYVW